MTRVLTALLLTFTLFLWVGCSDDDNPVDSNDNGSQTETFTADASGYDEFTYFSLSAGDTVSAGVGKVMATGWDIAFRRYDVKLNGGTSGDGGVVGADLGEVDYDAVTIDDTTGAYWIEDTDGYFIDQWYTYDMETHMLSANQYVYSMVDAEGDNYIKFRVDSIVGAGMPPDMGIVWISYFYQATASSTDLDGAIQEASIPIGSNTGYFDFSSGTAVTPADPSTSTGWDIAFHSYNLIQNSGPNGPGECGAYPAWQDLADPTEIEGLLSQPSGPPMSPDGPSCALTNWYNYDGQTHRLTSKGNVYLLKTGDVVYKLEILSYYANVGGTPVSGHYTFQWEQL